ncbi:MAG: hypothetical protein LBJ80_00100 [Rickettsiales bacterium]|jgi:hypothetical protein|nr:hypothetical protein [Rickettsiales bacterium]
MPKFLKVNKEEYKKNPLAYTLGLDKELRTDPLHFWQYENKQPPKTPLSISAIASLTDTFNALRIPSFKMERFYMAPGRSNKDSSIDLSMYRQSPHEFVEDVYRKISTISSFFENPDYAEHINELYKVASYGKAANEQTEKSLRYLLPYFNQALDEHQFYNESQIKKLQLPKEHKKIELEYIENQEQERRAQSTADRNSIVQKLSETEQRLGALRLEERKRQRTPLVDDILDDDLKDIGKYSEWDVDISKIGVDDILGDDLKDIGKYSEEGIKPTISADEALLMKEIEDDFKRTFDPKILEEKKFYDEKLSKLKEPTYPVSPILNKSGRMMSGTGPVNTTQSRIDEIYRAEADLERFRKAKDEHETKLIEQYRGIERADIGFKFSHSDTEAQTYQKARDALSRLGGRGVKVGDFSVALFTSMKFPEFYDNYKRTKMDFQNAESKLSNLRKAIAPLIVVGEDPTRKVKDSLGTILASKKSSTAAPKLVPAKIIPKGSEHLPVYLYPTNRTSKNLQEIAQFKQQITKYKQDLAVYNKDREDITGQWDKKYEVYMQEKETYMQNKMEEKKQEKEELIQIRKQIAETELNKSMYEMQLKEKETEDTARAEYTKKQKNVLTTKIEEEEPELKRLIEVSNALSKDYSARFTLETAFNTVPIEQMKSIQREVVKLEDYVKATAPPFLQILP